MILAYVGPDSMLPMTSIVAAVASVVLVLGRSSLRYLGEMLQAVRGRK